MGEAQRKPAEKAPQDWRNVFYDHAGAALSEGQRIIAPGQPKIGIEEKKTWPSERMISLAGRGGSAGAPGQHFNYV